MASQLRQRGHKSVDSGFRGLEVIGIVDDHGKAQRTSVVTRHIAGHGGHIPQTAGFDTDETSLVSIVQTIRGSAHESHDRQSFGSGGSGTARQVALLHFQQGAHGKFGPLGQARTVGHDETFGGDSPLNQHLFD